MASTNKTTNYELSQFIETDRPAWLTDYNGDMRKLDTALKAVSDVASGASGGISSLTDRMTAAEGAITTNANDITALDARTDALEAGAQSTTGTIANIQTEQTAQNLGIEAATELGYNLARPYDSASTYTVGAYVLFQNTLYKCVTAVSTGEAFDPTKWIAIKAMDEVGGGGSGSIQLETIPNSEIFEIQSGDIASSIPSGNSYKYGNLLFVDLMFTFPSRTQSIYQSGDLYIAHLKSNYQPLAFIDGRPTLVGSKNLGTGGEVTAVQDIRLIASNRGILYHLFKIQTEDITYSACIFIGIILLNN